MTIATEQQSNLAAVQWFKCLADETRLRIMLLVYEERELCVCELTEALNLSQPKISRHLANLRLCGLLTDQRRGQWVFYRLAETLPHWANQVLAVTSADQQALMTSARYRLAVMKDRPERCC
ncbi:MAG: metalloregulator ArsR/SmtB family transcription factor [Natronospirillum sp.]